MAQLLSNPIITINAVDLSNQCSGASVTLPTFTALSSTSFGDVADVFVAGLQSNEWSFDLFWSTATGETMATIQGLVGTNTACTLKSTSAAVSATNPLYTMTGFIASMPVVYAVGALSTCTITVQGGAVVTTTS